MSIASGLVLTVHRRLFKSLNFLVDRLSLVFNLEDVVVTTTIAFVQRALPSHLVSTFLLLFVY